jgi:hypothetical protein
LADLDSQNVISLGHPLTLTVERSDTQVSYMERGNTNTISLSVPTRPAIMNGDFSQGMWGPVGNCNDAVKAQPGRDIRADLIPRGAPGGGAALRLSASIDSACEIQALNWHGGALVVSLLINQVQGAAPRLCVWEIGPQRCAALPNPSSTSGWSVYRASVFPDAGTTSLAVYLYADAGPKGQTISEYANVQIREVAARQTWVLLGTPRLTPSDTPRLVVDESTFSPQWESTIGMHVLVNGMLNGWLTPPQGALARPFFLPATVIAVAQWVSVVAFLIALLVVTGTASSRKKQGTCARFAWEALRHRSHTPP